MLIADEVLIGYDFTQSGVGGCLVEREGRNKAEAWLDTQAEPDFCQFYFEKTCCFHVNYSHATAGSG